MVWQALAGPDRNPIWMPLRIYNGVEGKGACGGEPHVVQRTWTILPALNLRCLQHTWKRADPDAGKERRIDRC